MAALVLVDESCCFLIERSAATKRGIFSTGMSAATWHLMAPQLFSTSLKISRRVQAKIAGTSAYHTGNHTTITIMLSIDVMPQRVTVSLPGPGRGGGTWNLLVFIYFLSPQQRLRQLSYCITRCLAGTQTKLKYAFNRYRHDQPGADSLILVCPTQLYL